MTAFVTRMCGAPSVRMIAARMAWIDSGWVMSAWTIMPRTPSAWSSSHSDRRGVGVTEIVQRHVGAASGQRARQHPTELPTGSGDHGDFSGQIDG